MLGWRPSVVYKYLWKYVGLLAMLGLLGASLIRMVLQRPTYLAWSQEKVRSPLGRGGPHGGGGGGGPMC
jgi:solute carrier family 6 amino acid/orphan transporter-like 15/16/17/18/20